jgi:hypothetical protein
MIRHHRPDRVAIEDVFYAVNVKSALKLGQVRGVAMLAASSLGVTVSEYAPLTIKAAVVGYGRAEKEQVQLMVARLLRLEEIPHPADAADALAIAFAIPTWATLSRQGAVAGDFRPHFWHNFLICKSGFADCSWLRCSARLQWLRGERIGNGKLQPRFSGANPGHYEITVAEDGHGSYTQRQLN